MRKALAITFSLLFAASLTGTIICLIQSPNNQSITGIFTFSSCILVLVLAFTARSYIVNESPNKNLELKKIEDEREDLLKRIKENKTTDKQTNATDTVLLNLNRITEYYTINLAQAKSSYRWSITSIVFGTLIIAYCIWSFTSRESSNLTMPIISGIAGIIMEFIGGCYFFMYKKSLSQLNLYFKELLKIQDTMLAIELCEKLKESVDIYPNSVNAIITELLQRNSKLN